ncbi:MAG: hypothetical protein WBF17_01995 [Phycisphaerae bacterium]
MAFDGKAKALLVFGAAGRPAVAINEVAYTGKMPTARIDGKSAWVVPLFDASPAEAVEGLVERFRKAQAALPPASAASERHKATDSPSAGP